MDCARPRDPYYRPDEKLFTDELHRLLGHHWEKTEKACSPTPDPDSATIPG